MCLVVFFCLLAYWLFCFEWGFVLFCFFFLGELIVVFFRFVFSFACLDKEIKTILFHYV